MNEAYMPSEIYQSLCRLFPQEDNAGLQNNDLTPEQRARVLAILSEADLSTRQTRKVLIMEIKVNPTIARIVHSTIKSLNLAENGHLNQDCFAFDAELNGAIFDSLQEAMGKEYREKGPALNEWLTKFGVYFDKQTINSLETYDLFSLAALLAEPSLQNHEYCSTILSNLPQMAINYNKFICREPRDIHLLVNNFQSICAESTEPIQYAALAHFISLRKISIETLTGSLGKERLIKLAPYLRYGDFRYLNSELTADLLKNAFMLNHLLINNPTIESLPQEMSALQRLDCWGCVSLQSLPQDMPVLQGLDCKRCTSLQSLPQKMPALQRLDCSGCTSLQSLPQELPALQELYCSRCTRLESLPQEMPALQRLDCYSCESLRSLPRALPALRQLHCANCNALDGNMPEMPADATVITENSPMEFTKLEVDVNEIATCPKKILLQLGQLYLLQNKPFPNIYYFENGKRLEAVDVGGVRRDFITRLMESIFVQSETGNNRLLLDRSGTPLTDDQPDTDLAYRSLGRIFGLCYPVDSFFKTGELFEAEVYGRIACMPGEELVNLSEERLVSLYQAYLGISSEVAKVINDSENNTELSDLAIAQFGALVDAVTLNAQRFERTDFAFKTNSEVQTFLQDRTNRAKLKHDIVKEVLVNSNIEALNLIAIGIRGLLGEGEWENFCVQDAAILHDRIEGTLTKEKLLGQIQWKISPSVSQEQLENVQMFMTDWIERADLGMLRKFVRAVTANNTLGKDKLKFELYSRGPDFIPVSHTCFFTLELSSEYPNQKHFDDKLELLLTEGMAGSGFQVA